MNKHSGNNVINLIKKLSIKDFIDFNFKEINKKIANFSKEKKGK